MPGGERGPIALLGRRKLGDEVSEGRPPCLRVSREEFCDPAECAIAENGTRLAKARDAVCRHSVGGFEHDALRRVTRPYRLSAALLPGDGHEDRAAGGGGRKRLSGFGCNEREWDSIRARQSLFPVSGRIV